MERLTREDWDRVRGKLAPSAMEFRNEFRAKGMTPKGALNRAIADTVLKYFGSYPADRRRGLEQAIRSEVGKIDAQKRAQMKQEKEKRGEERRVRREIAERQVLLF